MTLFLSSAGDERIGVENESTFIKRPDIVVA